MPNKSRPPSSGKLSAGPQLVERRPPEGIEALLSFEIYQDLDESGPAGYALVVLIIGQAEGRETNRTLLRSDREGFNSFEEAKSAAENFGFPGVRIEKLWRSEAALRDAMEAGEREILCGSYERLVGPPIDDEGYLRLR